MTSWLMNRIEVMPGIDEYLSARGNAERYVARISQFRHETEQLLAALHGRPQLAIQQLPATWINLDELRELLRGAISSFETMQNRWNELAPHDQNHISPPIMTLDGDVGPRR